MLCWVIASSAQVAHLQGYSIHTKPEPNFVGPSRATQTSNALNSQEIVESTQLVQAQANEQYAELQALP